MEWLEQIFRDLKMWFLFVIGVFVAFVVYYYFVFPGVEQILVSKLYKTKIYCVYYASNNLQNSSSEIAQFLGENTLDMKRPGNILAENTQDVLSAEKSRIYIYKFKEGNCKITSSDGWYPILSVAFEYPEEVSSFASEAIRVYINRFPVQTKESAVVVDQKICFRFEQFVFEQEKFRFYVYTCRTQTNLYQCPSSEREICIAPYETHKIGRWFIIYYSPITREKKDLSMALEVGTSPSIQNAPKLSIRPYQNFQEFSFILLRAFIWYMLLPPRSNILLVTLAAFSVLFFGNFVSSDVLLEDNLRVLMNLKRVVGEKRTKFLIKFLKYNMEFFGSSVGVIFIELIIMLSVYCFVYLTAVYGWLLGILFPLLAIFLMHIISSCAKKEKEKDISWFKES